VCRTRSTRCSEARIADDASAVVQSAAPMHATSTGVDQLDEIPFRFSSGTRSFFVRTLAITSICFLEPERYCLNDVQRFQSAEENAAQPAFRCIMCSDHEIVRATAASCSRESKGRPQLGVSGYELLPRFSKPVEGGSQQICDSPRGRLWS